MIGRLARAVGLLILVSLKASAQEMGPGEEPGGAPEFAPLPAVLRYSDGRPDEDLGLIQSAREAWISVRDVAALFKATRTWRPDLQKMYLKIADHEITVAVGAEAAFIDGETSLHLPGPVPYREGTVYLPLGLFAAGAGDPLAWLPGNLLWDPAKSQLLVAGTPPGRLSGLSVVSGHEYRLDLELDRPFEYRIVSSVPARFVLRLPGASFDPDSLTVPDGGEGFLALAAAVVPNGVEVSFGVPEAVQGYQIIRQEKPHRLSVILSLDERAVREGRLIPLFRSLWGPDAVLRTIVIDPGHGGGDPGASTPGGLSEARFVLSLAQRLALDLEEKLGVTVRLTRDTDREVSLTARTETANMAPADLFLSLHMDGHASPGVSGPRAVVARPEPGPPRGVGGPLRELGFQVWGDAQRVHLNRAYGLADRLVGEVSTALGLKSRGVEEWPLPVLSAALMPAVFLEIDSMTSGTADARLSAPEFQSRVSEAIVTAIDRFRREVP